MKKVSKIILGLFLLFSCTDFRGTWDSYIIEAGGDYSHRSGFPECHPGLPCNPASLKDGRHMVFDARFTTSCLYDRVALDPEEDINKLYGFTDCNSAVRENSARFGWRPTKDQTQMEIWSYAYSAGHPYYHFMGLTNIGQVDHYEIWEKLDHYYFYFNGKEQLEDRSKNCVHGVRFRDFPFFGGNKKAPHRMEIFIYEQS